MKPQLHTSTQVPTSLYTIPSPIKIALENGTSTTLPRRYTYLNFRERPDLPPLKIKRTGNDLPVRNEGGLNNFESNSIPNTETVSNDYPGMKEELTISSITETGVLPFTKSSVVSNSVPESMGTTRWCKPKCEQKIRND